MKGCFILDCNVTNFYATSSSIHVKLKLLKPVDSDLLQKRQPPSSCLTCSFAAVPFQEQAFLKLMLLVGHGL